MQNGKTEPAGVTRSRTECTASGEVRPFGAFYQAATLLYGAEKGFRINKLTPKLYIGTARGEVC